MADLLFEDFITCFRKQFLLQKGRGGRRISPYYTNWNGYNGTQRMDNDEWGIMVFIYVGSMYGFTDRQMHIELRIDKDLYRRLKLEVVSVIGPHYHDRMLHNKVLTKIGLVKNIIYFAYSIRPTFPFL